MTGACRGPVNSRARHSSQRVSWRERSEGEPTGPMTMRSTGRCGRKGAQNPSCPVGAQWPMGEAHEAGSKVQVNRYGYDHQEVAGRQKPKNKHGRARAASFSREVFCRRQGRGRSMENSAVRGAFAGFERIAENRIAPQSRSRGRAANSTKDHSGEVMRASQFGPTVTRCAGC